MEKALYRFEVYYKTHDVRGAVVRESLRSAGFSVDSVVMTDNYLVNAPGAEGVIDRVGALLVQPVTQAFTVNSPYVPENFTCAVEIGYLPGVTDNVSHTVRESIEDLLKTPLDREKSVFSSVTYFLTGNISSESARAIAKELHNPLIQRSVILYKDEYIKENGFGNMIPVVSIHERGEADVVSLNVGADELSAIAREGIKDSDGTRRGPLALDMMSMNVIIDYFKKENRQPTDIELESIAQTWSEHCKHTIFAAKIDDVDEGVFKRYIREATIKIRRDKGEKDFCRSVFTDNAGGIDFDENFIVADKVETHNSPSALDPFGGSITGIVGVNRDAMGFGMGARPIANRYGFCFANPFDRSPVYRDRAKTNPLLTPRRIMDGVIKGVNAGGNTSGIPTPQGFVYFDDRYKGKPLVFVGTVGLIPKFVNGKSSVEKTAMPGDIIVMAGGRVGRDGIHGATFSSEALTSGSPATAVQIGDPITQKKLSDAIVREARETGLYNSITDNGAGGLSCSVAEMAKESGGFEVDLELVPLKYPGLAPWQIWVSESQERMTLSVPPAKLDEFIKLMERRGVEAAAIGKFTGGSRGIVRYHGKVIFDLDMNFLHEGLPRKELTTRAPSRRSDKPDFAQPADMNEIFIKMNSRLNTASYEFISSQYDHEVQANSVVKPLQGPGRVNGSASVIRPVPDSYKGVVLSQGLYPSYSEMDPYLMAACSIDTAVRNAVSVGGSVDTMAILDNFCWCDSNNPERLSQLLDAARACYDTAVAYGTPFISGKDSMFNDFKGFDENGNEKAISIPPTLLVSSIGVIEDVRNCQTIDFKKAGDFIYLAGATYEETGGSEYLSLMGELLNGRAFAGERVPAVDPELFIKIYRSAEAALNKGIIASSVSIERGGLGTAAARASMAGLLGFEIDLSKMKGDFSRDDFALFSESQGRLLFSVSPENAAAFEEIFKGLPAAKIGEVRADGKITVRGIQGQTIIDAQLDKLTAAYRSLFAGF
jgi:phosphoribosylformylglycinamidine synthase